MVHITKCALLTVVSLAIIKDSTANDQESIFKEVKKTNTVITVTNEVNYVPPMMILGFANGTIARCPQATPSSCEIYHVASSLVVATAVHGEFLFAAQAPSSILRCRWQKKHSCMVFYQTGSQITGLAIAYGYIHAGLINGTITRCELNTPNSCQPFVNLGRKITSITAFGRFLYTGSDDGQIHRCSDSCSLFCKTGGSEITGLAVVDKTIYGVRYGGYIQYGILTGNSCIEYSIPGDGFKTMGVYDEKLYIVQEPGTLHVIDRSTHDRSQFVVHKNAISVSFAYGTCAMQEQYQMESRKCIWRGVFQCPPTVIYYDVHERNTWEISVENGSLYNSQGALVDTTTADESYSQKAAVFVMGLDGQILLSNFHKTGLLHTSSLMAGNPVSGAGLMVVNQGKIKKITACSIHYRPDKELNSLVIQALYQKGYTDQIDSESCTYNSMLCVQDAMNIGNHY